MKRISKEEFEERVKNRFPTEKFEVLEFSGMGTPLLIKCCNCEKNIQVNKASNFFAKNKAYGCKECHGLWRQREQKIEQIRQFYNIKSTFVKETHTYYNIECKKCGHCRTGTLSDLIRHLDCGCVTGAKRSRTAEEFINEANQHCREGFYQLVGEYKNQTEKVLLKHSCGFVWNVRPGDMIHGRSFCPKCGRKESKYENFIKQLLQKLKIPFEQEKKLDNSLQRFDFYLEINKNKIAIEYNGEQHYKETNFFKGGLETFQERDQKKQQYCIDNNINLLTIPYTYTDKQIIDTITNFINKFNDYPEKEYIQVNGKSIPYKEDIVSTHMKV